jgi:predicted ArsR family transcriptional regulator
VRLPSLRRGPPTVSAMGVLDAVADPVRLRVVRHLARHDSATLGELADAAGVHLNTIRAHVASLEEAEVLVSTQKPASGPGRPATEYRLADGWGLSSTDFLELAGLLAAALVRSRPDTEALRATGADWGRYLVGRPGRHDVATQVPLALERLGFHADVAGETVRITGCPCTAVSPDHPEVVCALASGLVDGVLAASGSDVRVAHHDANPEARRCTLLLTKVAGTAPGAAEPAESR